MLQKGNILIYALDLTLPIKTVIYQCMEKEERVVSEQPTPYAECHYIIHLF